MDAQELSFSGSDVSNGNIAIAALMARIPEIKDSGIPSGPKMRAPIPIWKSTARCLGLPSYSDDDPLVVFDVRKDQAPACIVFDGFDEHVTRAVAWSDTELWMHVRLQFFIYVLGSSVGSYPKAQELRRNITRATLRGLRAPSVDNLNGWEDPDLINGQFPFWIEAPQNALADYGTELNNLFPKFPIVPPWWTWHVNLLIKATNV